MYLLFPHCTICDTSSDLVDVPRSRDSADVLESLCSESDGYEPDLHSCNSHSDFVNDGNPSTCDKVTGYMCPSIFD